MLLLQVTTLSLNPENRTVQRTKCAKSSSEGFIVGGTKSEPGEFPHMAAIGWQQDENSGIEWNCGGSLIRYNNWYIRNRRLDNNTLIFSLC